MSTRRHVPAGEPIGLVIQKTPFYAEAGGQVADTGVLSVKDLSFEVDDVVVAAGFVLHHTKAGTAPISVGDTVTASVDYERRNRIAPNHTFTHILNYALRKVLGDHVEQRGSIVLPDKLRFDFTNNGAIPPEKLAEIEGICTEFVESPRDVFAQEVPLAQAKEISGLRAVFGEVYPDPVRVVSVGKGVDHLLKGDGDNSPFAIEFCGGTHLTCTSQAGQFALVSEEGIAKGVRRIVAITGEDARQAIEDAKDLEKRLKDALALPSSEIGSLASDLKIAVDQATISATSKNVLREMVQELTKKVIEEQKKVAAANKAKAIEAALGAADNAVAEGKKYLVMEIPDIGLDNKSIQEAWKAIQKKHPSLSVMLFAAGDDKGLAFAGVPKEVSKTFSAGDWLKETIQVMGGKGGGKPTNAQGMGPNVDAIPAAADLAQKFAAAKL